MYKISELFKEFDRTNVKETNKINFIGVDGFDVYNITAPFIDNGCLYIAGRVEKRDSEHSNIMFFKQINELDYQLDESLPTFELQDPYVTFIDGKLVLGGTKIFDHPNIPGALWYCAHKYIGSEISDLKLFFEGPNGMKDIRLLELADKRIVCFTRPQGELGGRGKIGYYLLNDLTELSITGINQAPLLDLFDEVEWGGANEAHLLADGTVGVLGHIARFDEAGNRHYHAISFVLNLQTNEVSNFKIILVRDQLVHGESKRPDLEDVIFSGGLVKTNDKWQLYVGAGDCEGHFAVIENPFGKEVQWV
ncbi:MAG: DUF1861 family protein [Mycoplasmatales bacterium]